MEIQNKFFIVSSSCKSVRGVSRSLIIDYLRDEMYFISDEYYELLQKIDRKKIGETYDLIEDKSINSFMDFLNFLINKEIGFLIDNLEQFPLISERTNDFFPLKDAIIELDENLYSQLDFLSIIKQLDELFCNDVQIRLLSKFNFKFINLILSIINNSNIRYLELHFTYDESVEKNILFNFIKNHSALTNIYIYKSPKSIVENYLLETSGYHSTEIGKVYYLSYDFNDGNCCGIITKENLSFQSVQQHNELNKVNGCLYKKISIDKFGNLKNCPSINKNFGNIKNNLIKEIIENNEFKKLGKINKNEIQICQSCEFRYNCTDCRAYLLDENNIHSKPLKCGYNPQTCEWEDWSDNSLKSVKITKYISK